MAILIRGKMRCPLCGTTIRNQDEAARFSPFVMNETDPLFQFSDRAFHADCFNQHPLASRCRDVYEQTRMALALKNRICAVCGSAIDDPDEYLTVGYLTSQEDHPLHGYNYLQFHRSCLPDWDDLPAFHEALDEAHQRGEFTGPAVEKLLQELEGFLSKVPE